MCAVVRSLAEQGYSVARLVAVFQGSGGFGVSLHRGNSAGNKATLL